MDIIALGAGLGVWGVVNLLEGYGNDNPGAKSQGMKRISGFHKGFDITHGVVIVVCKSYFWWYVMHTSGKQNS